MRHQLRNTLVGAILLAILDGFALPVARGAQGEEHRRVALTPAWTTGIISRWAGVANIIVDDLDLDGLVTSYHLHTLLPYTYAQPIDTLRRVFRG